MCFSFSLLTILEGPSGSLHLRNVCKITPLNMLLTTSIKVWIVLFQKLVHVRKKGVVEYICCILSRSASIFTCIWNYNLSFCFIICITGLWCRAAYWATALTSCLLLMNADAQLCLFGPSTTFQKSV